MTPIRFNAFCAFRLSDDMQMMAIIRKKLRFNVLNVFMIIFFRLLKINAAKLLRQATPALAYNATVKNIFADYDKTEILSIQKTKF